MLTAAKARAGKNSFPPTPFLFARPSVQFGALARRQFRSKKVRISSNKRTNGKTRKTTCFLVVLVIHSCWISIKLVR